MAYTYNRIKPSEIISLNGFLRLLEKLDSTFDFFRIEFEAGSFEAKFEYDYLRLIKMIEEHEVIDWVKLIQKHENEIFLGFKNSFIYINTNEQNLFNFFLSQINFKWSFSLDHIDYFLQTSDDPSTWRRHNMKIPNDVILFPDPMDWRKEGKMLINEETLPGHEHILRNEGKVFLWFGATWQMYFSDIYYKYIPKPLWDSFDYCEENTILENGLRKITLYKNPDDYELKENRDRQWAFRRQLGIDSIAHEVCSEKTRSPKDSPIEITKVNCEKGQTKVIRYLDKKDNLTIPRKAKKKEIKEYLDDGITVVLERIEKV